MMETSSNETTLNKPVNVIRNTDIRDNHIQELVRKILQQSAVNLVASPSSSGHKRVSISPSPLMITSLENDLLVALSHISSARTLSRCIMWIDAVERHRPKWSTTDRFSMQFQYDLCDLVLKVARDCRSRQLLLTGIARKRALCAFELLLKVHTETMHGANLATYPRPASFSNDSALLSKQNSHRAEAFSWLSKCLSSASVVTVATKGI